MMNLANVPMLWVPAFAGTMGRFSEYQHCLALTRIRFAGAGELCMDTQDGQDRINEMLYISPERKWIEGAKVDRRSEQQGSIRMLNELTSPAHPPYAIPFIVTVQSCGESVIASAARQSRWRKGVLRDKRGCYGVEIATAQAPRNDNLLNSEQLPFIPCIHANCASSVKWVRVSA